MAAELRGLLPSDVAPFQFVFAGIVPEVETLKRDLGRAGITFLDEEGRRADFYALRNTFGTSLVLSGAEPRVVMELMRHKMNILVDIPIDLQEPHGLQYRPSDRREPMDAFEFLMFNELGKGVCASLGDNIKSIAKFEGVVDIRNVRVTEGLQFSEFGLCLRSDLVVGALGLSLKLEGSHAGHLAMSEYRGTEGRERNWNLKWATENGPKSDPK